MEHRTSRGEGVSAEARVAMQVAYAYVTPLGVPRDICQCLTGTPGLWLDKFGSYRAGHYLPRALL